MDTPERRVWGERSEDRVTLQIILVFTLKCCDLLKNSLIIVGMAMSNKFLELWVVST
jgi:hypothetical protein